MLYSDTVNGYGVGRDDLWLATTDALKSAQPVEVQRVPLTTMQPSGDQLRAIAQTARNMNGPSDTTTGCEYALAGWKAAVEVQRVPLTDATKLEKDVARWMEKDGLTREQAECEVNYRTTRKALKSGLSAHGIKPTSSEGGA